MADADGIEGADHHFDAGSFASPAARKASVSRTRLPRSSYVDVLEFIVASGVLCGHIRGVMAYAGPVISYLLHS